MRCFPWRRTRTRREVATASPKAGHAVPWAAGAGTEVGRTNVGPAGAFRTSGGGAPQRGDGTNLAAGIEEKRRVTVGPETTEEPVLQALGTGPTVAVDLAPHPGPGHGLPGHEIVPETGVSARKGGPRERTARRPVPCLQRVGPPTRLTGTLTTGRASHHYPRRRRRQQCRQQRQPPPTMGRHPAAPSTPRPPSAAETMTSAGTVCGVTTAPSTMATTR